MTHWISGLVASRAILDAIAAEHRLGKPAALAFDLAFVPLDDSNLDAIVRLADKPEPDPEAHDGEDWDYLHSALIEWCTRQSRDTAIAYIETQYWGGDGGQGAVLFEKGDLVWGPERGIGGCGGPISTVLARLGVSRGTAYDEFEAAGIARHRTNDAWREYATG